jgi:hypothetical protein
MDSDCDACLLLAPGDSSSGIYGQETCVPKAMLTVLFHQMPRMYLGRLLENGLLTGDGLSLVMLWNQSRGPASEASLRYCDDVFVPSELHLPDYRVNEV